MGDERDEGLSSEEMLRQAREQLRRSSVGQDDGLRGEDLRPQAPEPPRERSTSDETASDPQSRPIHAYREHPEPPSLPPPPVPTRPPSLPTRPQPPWYTRGRVLIAAGIVIFFVISLFRSGTDDSSPGDIPSPPSISAAADVERFVITDVRHTDGTVAYPQDPPAGGRHAPIWQECGFYESPINNENGVHTLEHGAVWITYQPDLASAQIDVLRSIAEEDEVLVSPYPGLDAPVVATSWGNQLRLGSADAPRLNDFIEEYVDGPDAPEPRAGCNDGRGVTAVPIGGTATAAPLQASLLRSFGASAPL